MEIMVMKIELKDITAKIQPLVQFIKRYIVFMFVITLFVIFGFFILRISQFSQIEPSDDAISEKLKTVQRPKIDNAVLDKIEQLNDQNIQVKSLFDQARNNPFTE